VHYTVKAGSLDAVNPGGFAWHPLAPAGRGVIPMGSMLMGLAGASVSRPTWSWGEARVWLPYQARGPLSESLRLVYSEVPGGERAAGKQFVLTLLLDPD